MGELGNRIHHLIDNTAEASRVLSKYFDGRYTGALFDTDPALASPDPDSFTAHDIAAVATLSVPMSGRAVQELLAVDAELHKHLTAIDDDLDLADASDDALEQVYAIQRVLDGVHDVGPVTRSKLLARKRPRLIPIRDQHVLATLVGSDGDSFTSALRDTLRDDDSIAAQLTEIQALARTPTVSTLRALDIVVWMNAHGDQQVPN